MIAALNPKSDLARKAFTLTIEPGHEEMWFVMRDLRGAFTAEDVALATGAKPAHVRRYLSHLIRIGIASEAGLSSDRKVMFQVVPLGATPKVFDGKGDDSADFALRRELWLATRNIKDCVTEGRLLDMVGQEIPVTRRQVKAWIARLVAADYLTEMFGHYAKPKTGDTEYTLRQLRNTGPLPPRFCEADLIFDVNLARRGHPANAFFGVGLAREVKL